MELAPEQVLVAFRAGRAYLENGVVRSDSRKGCVRVTRAEDGLVHFQWYDRTTGAVEEDLIVFPAESNWKRVAACRTGRVFVLTFASSDLQLFFWMQEPRPGVDARLAQRVRNALECRALDDPAGLDPEDESPAEAALASPAAATGSAAALETAPHTDAAFAQALSEALERLQEGALAEQSPATSSGTASDPTVDGCPSLTALLAWRPALQRALQEPGLQTAASALLGEYLPESFDLESVLRSAAFRQQLRSLSEALRRSRGDAYPLFQAFGLEPPEGDWPNDLEALVEALQRRSCQSSSNARRPTSSGTDHHANSA
jgi:hypothetical protein